MEAGLFTEESEHEGNGTKANQEASQIHENDSTKSDNPIDDQSKAETPPKKRRTRTIKNYPAVTFEEALELPLAIQYHASGQRVRRLRLFELLGRSADSSTSRNLITNSSRYGLTTGNHSAEWIELTPEGRIATADDVPEREKIRTRFKLAIESIAPFKKLYDQFVSNRLPAKSVMSDFLREDGMNSDDVSECVDTFLLNAKFVNVLKNTAGAERLLTLDHVLDYAPSGVQPSFPPTPSRVVPKTTIFENEPDSTDSFQKDTEIWDRICFYITPIGDEGSDTRKHSDLFLGSIIEPALEEFDLDVVRADKITEPGMISRQVIEHILRSRLVIADLSYHNPNVFYELALRHSSGLPTVQIMRASDHLPFDVNQVRTIVIDTSDIYTLVPQIDVYRTAIATQVRRAIENPDEVDNPITPFYPLLKKQNRG